MNKAILNSLRSHIRNWSKRHGYTFRSNAGKYVTHDEMLEFSIGNRSLTIILVLDSTILALFGFTDIVDRYDYAEYTVDLTDPDSLSKLDQYLYKIMAVDQYLAGHRS